MTEPLAGAGAGEPETGAALRRERIEIERGRLFFDWRRARDRARAYLAALGLPAPAARSLAEEAALRAAMQPPSAPEDGALASTLAELRGLLLESHPQRALLPAPGEPDEFVTWRLEAMLARGGAPPAPLARSGPRRLDSMPPLARGAMIPHRFVRRGAPRDHARPLRAERRRSQHGAPGPPCAPLVVDGAPASAAARDPGADPERDRGRVHA
jgi:hypothetical protein